MIEKIREAMEWADRAGYDISPGDWGVTYQYNRWENVSTCLCPLGALLLRESPPVIDDNSEEPGWFVEVLHKLFPETSTAWFDGFVMGVDGGFFVEEKPTGVDVDYREGMKQGQGIREKLIA